MSNLFSFAGNFSSFVHIYNQLYSTDEFQDFTNNINEGTPKEIMSGFIRNLIFKQVDPIISPYLENSEIIQIMANKNMNHQDKCKIVGGKITNYIIDHHPLFNTRRSETESLIGFIADKKKIIEETLETISHIENLDRVETVHDVYTVVINDMSKELVKTIEPLLSLLLSFNLQEEEYLDKVQNILKMFNENYEYQSEFCNDDLIDYDNDDSDDDSDNSDSDDGNDLHTPVNKKRTFEQMNDSEDNEKPANKRNKK